MLRGAMRTAGLISALALFAGTASAASLLVQVDRELAPPGFVSTDPVEAGEQIRITVGISLNPDESLDGAQLGFDIEGGIPVGFTEPLYEYDLVFPGEPDPIVIPMTEEPWSLTQSIGVGPLTEVLTVNAMNVQTGDPMAPPYYGASQDAIDSGVKPEFAPLGVIDVVANGLDGFLIIPDNVNPADVFALPGDVDPDFGPGTVVKLWRGVDTPEPGAALLLGLGLAALGFARSRSA